jgi:hypothetical protein
MPLVVRRFGSIFGVILLLVLLIYTFARTKDLLFGAGLTLSQNKSAVNGSEILTLSGVAKRAKELSINGRPIPTELSGAFTDTLALVPGYNIVSVRSKDILGRVSEKTFATYYTPNTATAVAQAPTTVSGL